MKRMKMEKRGKWKRMKINGKKENGKWKKGKWKRMNENGKE